MLYGKVKPGNAKSEKALGCSVKYPIGASLD